MGSAPFLRLAPRLLVRPRMPVSTASGRASILCSPIPQAPPSPVPADTPFVDSAIALAYLAAHTTRIKLGTGIIILPQRNPAVLAKELASVDVVSGGRLIFGIGIGYLKPEFDALGAPFDHKGPRTEEYLAAMIALWTMEKPEYRGRFVSFGGVNAMPRPVQKPHPEVVFGGHSKDAYSRTARLANGMVRVCAGPRGHGEVRRGTACGMQGYGTALRGPGGERHAARTHGPRHRQTFCAIGRASFRPAIADAPSRRY